MIFRNGSLQRAGIVFSSFFVRFEGCLVIDNDESKKIRQGHRETHREIVSFSREASKVERPNQDTNEKQKMPRDIIILGDGHSIRANGYCRS